MFAFLSRSLPEIELQESGTFGFTSLFLELKSADKDKPSAQPIGRGQTSEFHFCSLAFI